MLRDLRRQVAQSLLRITKPVYDVHTVLQVLQRWNQWTYAQIILEVIRAKCNLRRNGSLAKVTSPPDFKIVQNKL